MSIGLTFPCEYATGSLGLFRTTETELDAVRENLKSLLLTNWGERLEHYYMGANLREFLFDPMVSEDLRVRIGDRVVTQVNKWLPFVSLKTLHIYFSGDPVPSNVGAPAAENGISVYMEFFLTSNPNQIAKLYQPIVS